MADELKPQLIVFHTGGTIVAEIEEVEDVVVDLVFEPQWTPDLITEDGKRLLGID